MRVYVCVCVCATFYRLLAHKLPGGRRRARPLRRFRVLFIERVRMAQVFSLYIGDQPFFAHPRRETEENRPNLYTLRFCQWHWNSEEKSNAIIATVFGEFCAPLRAVDVAINGFNAGRRVICEVQHNTRRPPTPTFHTSKRSQTRVPNTIARNEATCA